jgi:RNA polymerase sigma-70 factor (ECF subfamily)
MQSPDMRSNDVQHIGAPGAGFPERRGADTTTSLDFAELALPWMDSVYRYARSLTRDDDEAGDIVQDTYLHALAGWHTFHPGSDCRRWLFAICYNVFLRTRHRQRRYVSLEGDVPAIRPTGSRQHGIELVRMDEDEDEAPDVAPAIAKALARLPERYRSIVTLVDVEGLEYADAAAVTGIPVGTVRSRLFRGRRMLRTALAGHAADAGLVNAA